MWYLVVGAVPEVLEFLVVLLAEGIGLEQVVQFAVVGPVEGHRDAGPQHRFASVQQFRRRKRPDEPRQPLQITRLADNSISSNFIILSCLKLFIAVYNCL